MRDFKRLCVYCGSSNRVARHYFDTARQTGQLLAARGIDVVFGGGSVGLMGVLADAALEAGARVYGVIPTRLVDLEVSHHGLTELHVVDDMHQRKMRMAELADGFMALPGGWGTLEEMFEATTWTQLGYHNKPVGLLNAHGYYDHLVAFLGHAAAESFIRPTHRQLIQHDADPATLLDKLARVELPTLSDLERIVKRERG